MIELVIQSGKHQGKRLSLPATEVAVGRDEDCQIRLNSTDVSRRHCVLAVSDEGVRVRDLDSRNGTYVNDVQISGEVLLKPGDLLRIGPMVLQVPVAKAAAPQKSNGARSDHAQEAVAATAGANGPALAASPRKQTSPAAGPAATSAATSAAKRQKLTEDDIASWLTDDEIPIGSGDTTIVSGRAAPAEPSPPAVIKPEKKFRSVQEEAADIIRRHHEARARK